MNRMENSLMGFKEIIEGLNALHNSELESLERHSGMVSKAISQLKEIEGAIILEKRTLAKLEILQDELNFSSLNETINYLISEQWGKSRKTKAR